MTRDRTVRLGYELGTGAPVEIPIRHMAVTGQTQEAGKTTTLEALIERSELRALTFVTKRGEGSFARGRRLPPYFREQADWQFVASVLEASRGEKLKFERAWIIRASKGASTLRDVQRNVHALMEKAKGLSADVYLTLSAYLDVVVPTIGRIRWAPSIKLAAGVNVMDLVALPAEMQHLVIKSAIDWVLEHEHDTVVVVPEAWKFLPQGRGTPVKLSAAAYIRQGAALRNYLWLDSQDLGGIEKEILRSVAVWLLGVQREANEVKRTLSNIPGGVHKPKPADVQLLELGQFIACWGKHAVRTYVQPAWLDEHRARKVAIGELEAPLVNAAHEAQRRPSGGVHGKEVGTSAGARRADETARSRGEAPGEGPVPVPVGQPAARQARSLEEFVDRGRRAQAVADHLAYHGPGLTFAELAIGEPFWWAAPIPRGPEPMTKTSEDRYEWSRGTGTAEGYYRVERDAMTPAQEKKLDEVMTGIGRLVKALEAKGAKVTVGAHIPVAPAPISGGVTRGPVRATQEDLTVTEADFQWLKARLIEELPKDPRVMEIVLEQPELRVRVKREVIQVDHETLRGRLALLVYEGFFDQPKTSGNAFAEVQRRGFKTAHPNVSRELDTLARMGFLTRSNKWYTAVESMKRNITTDEAEV